MRRQPSKISLSKAHLEQGFIHSTAPTDQNAAEALPSLNLSETLTLNPQEVAHAFHLSFEELVSPSRLRSHDFRRHETEPYWAVNVSDRVTSETVAQGTSVGEEIQYASDPQHRDEIGGGVGGRLEVWGKSYALCVSVSWFNERLLHRADWVVPKCILARSTTVPRTRRVASTRVQ